MLQGEFLGDGLPEGEVSLPVHHAPQVHPVHVRDMVQQDQGAPLELVAGAKHSDLDAKRSLCNGNETESEWG